MKFREVTSDEWRTHLRAPDRVFQRKHGPVSSWRGWTVGRVKRAVYPQEMLLRGDDGLPKKILPLQIAVGASDAAAEKLAARLCEELLGEGYVETTAAQPGRRRRPAKPAPSKGARESRFAHTSLAPPSRWTPRGASW